MTGPGPLQRELSSGQFVVTAEIIPPVSTDPESVVAKAAPLKGLVDAVNVTDGAGARATMSSVAAAAILARAGFETVLQVTCRDRNRIALAGDLIGAATLGLRNLLVLHGDDPATGDQPDASAVHDLDSRATMTLARQMRDEGVLPSGRRITPPPRFFIGAADTPHDPPPEWAPRALETKRAAGADFVQTQFCFDAEVMRRYVARLDEAGVLDGLPFIVGVGPLASARSARWMRDNLFGVSVPDAVIARLEGAEDEAAEGRRMCVELIQALREIPGVSGVHVMAPRVGLEAVADVIDAARVRGGRTAGWRVAASS